MSMTSTQDSALGENVLAAAFLADVAEPVRDLLAGSVGLRDFLRSAGTLTLPERRLLVDQALVLLEQNYVHLPLKVAMHAVNPVQRLRLLRIRLERQTSDQLDPRPAHQLPPAQSLRGQGRLSAFPDGGVLRRLGRLALRRVPGGTGLLRTRVRPRCRGNPLERDPSRACHRPERRPVCRQ
jgi:hypothetical protein